MARPTIMEEKNKPASVLSLIPTNGDILLKELKDKCKRLKIFPVGNRGLSKILNGLLKDRKMVEATKIIKGRAVKCYRRKRWSTIFSDLIKQSSKVIKAIHEIEQEKEDSKQLYSSLSVIATASCHDLGHIALIPNHDETVRHLRSMLENYVLPMIGQLEPSAKQLAYNGYGLNADEVAFLQGLKEWDMLRKETLLFNCSHYT